jgi:hypothetical protein
MKSRNEYRSKVSDDSGIMRGRIPCTLLQDLGARVGDDVVFRLDRTSGKFFLKLSRAKKEKGKKAKNG